MFFSALLGIEGSRWKLYKRKESFKWSAVCACCVCICSCAFWTSVNLYTCLCLCFTYIKCGQECVSVFSLVNVVKRGLISSNIIHTVISHYSHIPTPFSASLCPLSPRLSLSHLSFASVVSFYVASIFSYTTCLSLLPWLPSFVLILVFFYSVSSSHHLPSHQLFYLSAQWALLYFPYGGHSQFSCFYPEAMITPAKRI